jgi:hypothetical protein
LEKLLLDKGFVFSSYKAEVEQMFGETGGSILSLKLHAFIELGNYSRMLKMTSIPPQQVFYEPSDDNKLAL